MSGISPSPFTFFKLDSPPGKAWTLSAIMSTCKPVSEYFDDARNGCNSCWKLCFEHDKQGTTRSCKELCADFLNSTATVTSPPTSSQFPPTVSIDGSPSRALIFWIVGCFMVVAVLIFVLYSCRKKLKRCFTCCPPSDKPPEGGTALDLGQGSTEAVAPQSDDCQGVNKLCIDGLGRHPIQSLDEPQMNPVSEEEGRRETTPMLPGPALEEVISTRV